jgi:hypothetical protein
LLFGDYGFVNSLLCPKLKRQYIHLVPLFPPNLMQQAHKIDAHLSLLHPRHKDTQITGFIALSAHLCPENLCNRCHT